MQFTKTFYATTQEPLEVLEPTRPKETFSDYIADIFGRAPSSLKEDGSIHRFDIDNKGGKPAWYVVTVDGDVSYGAFGNWRTGEKFTWTSRERLTPSQQERRDRFVQDAEEHAKLCHEAVALSATKIYENTEPLMGSHPYLEKKQVKGSDLLHISDSGELVIPVLDKDRNIQSLQYIDTEGKKRFLKGGSTDSGYFFVGDETNSQRRVYIAEGYATAASVYEATGRTCFVAFNAGNLPKVTEALKDDYDFTVVADNDESGTGEKYAKATGCPYIMPPIVGMDANDYMVAGHDLKELLEPQAEFDWLTTADTFIDNYKPSSWLIKNWLPRKATVMIYGAPASGKTFLVLDMLLTMSTHRGEWFGNKAKDADVVYLAGEGHEGLRKRMKFWKQEKGVSSFGNFAIAKSAVDLDKPQGLNLACDQIDKLPYVPDIIAVDTLNRFYSGDENSSQEIRGFIESCTELQRLYDCTVIIIHHTGVSDSAQERARGSSALKGAMDTELLVKKTEDGFIELKQTKQKDIDMLPPLELKLRGGVIDGWYDEDGDQLTSAILDSVESIDKREKCKKEINLLMGAWRGAEEMRYSSPFVSRETMKEYLEFGKGYTKMQIKSMLRTEPNRFIGKLLDAQIIEAKDDGWIIVDSVCRITVSRCQGGVKQI